MASGGAGPLHVCAIARELYIPTVIVPLFPSHFSALGMLMADLRRDYVQTLFARMDDLEMAELEDLTHDGPGVSGYGGYRFERRPAVGDGFRLR